VYQGMKRITLAVVVVLLAVPALAHAKAGIEFDNAIETANPNDRQSFNVLVMNEPTDPMGGEPQPITGAQPLVTFRNEETGKVIRVRASRTNSEGVARGAVTFNDDGPWATTLTVKGKPLAIHGQTFSVGPPREVNVVGTMEPPPDPPATPADDGGSFPAWLLTLPAAGLAALAIWRYRRRPRELGA
jgi:hypothetical protein